MKKFIATIFAALCLACQPEPKGVTSFIINCEDLAINERMLFWLGAGYRLEQYAGEGNFELIDITPERKELVLKGHMREADAVRFFNLSKEDLVFAEMVPAHESRSVLLALDSIIGGDSLLLTKPIISKEEVVAADKEISSTDQLFAEEEWTAEDSILRAWKIYEQPIENLVYLFEGWVDSISSPLVGMVDIKDTAEVNHILNIAATKGLLNNVRFVFAKEAEKESDNMLLYSVAYDPKLGDYRGLSGSYVEEMQVYDSKGDKYKAQINFYEEDGALLWEKLTRAQTGRHIAILLDNTLWSMPRVNGPIKDGYTAIQLGDTPLDQAMQFAIILNIGPMKYQSEIEQYRYDSTAIWSR